MTFQPRIIKTPADHAIPAIVRIYESRFPASERKPTDLLLRTIHRPDYRLIIMEEQTNPIGFALLFLPPEPSTAALLEYLAIDDQHQGRGLGTELVQAVIDLIDAHPLLIEVEAGSQPQAVRRRTFYRRLGFKELAGVDFVLPLPNAPAMQLMIINAPAPLERKMLTSWLTNIYQTVYSCPNEDPRLLKMLSKLPEKVKLKALMR